MLKIKIKKISGRSFKDVGILDPSESQWNKIEFLSYSKTI
jgi:hypothetical protein